MNLTAMKLEKLTLKEKISYGYGDLASNFVWGMATSYLLFFYTDIFGISAAAVGTLFLNHTNLGCGQRSANGNSCR